MSDIKALTIPKWGMAMEEGTLVNWLVNEGDTIGVGDEVAEIESSKIVNVMESHVAGTLRRKVAVEDEILPVGALLAVVADAGVSEEEIDKFIAGFTAVPQAVSTKEPGQAAAPAPAVMPQAQTAATASTGIPAALKQGGDDAHVLATPHARRLAQAQGINLNNVSGSGRHGRITVADIEQAVAGAGGALPAAPAVPHGVTITRSLEDDSHVHATPLARRLARQWGINLHDCRTSGSHGRVSKVDVEAVRRQREGGAPVPAAASWAAGPGVPAKPAMEDMPMSAIRQTIARRLQESKSTIPHYRLVAEAEIDALLDLRRELNAALPGADITVNDLLIKACATALMQVPDCNVQLHGHSIRRFRDADIAVAVALEEGLMTPIVTAANNKGIAQISNEVRDLVTRARAGTLQQHEFEGGSFTLSNLGMFGIKQFDAIINPPQCAILAVGKGEERVIVDQGEGAIATLLTLSLSLDHRVIDGATGARFMQALVRVLEHPGLMSA